MLKLLSPSLLERQQAYIDLMSHLYRHHALPFYAAHCGWTRSAQSIPIVVFGANPRLRCATCGRILDAELIYGQEDAETDVAH